MKIDISITIDHEKYLDDRLYHQLDDFLSVTDKVFLILISANKTYIFVLGKSKVLFKPDVYPDNMQLFLDALYKGYT